MPALTAVRKEPWPRAYHGRLIARGKLPKVALIAAMRELLIEVRTVAKHRRLIARIGRSVRDGAGRSSRAATF
jgi:hypothetical protein